jgi:hypothetical protein
MATAPTLSDQEADAVVAVSSTAQHGERIDGTR